MENQKKPGSRDASIQDLLLQCPGGLTIQDIASNLKVSTVTMTKDLDVMVAQKKIYRREIGSAKIHYHLKFARMFFQYKP